MSRTTTSYKCESCRAQTEVFYCKGTDEYLCDNCIMTKAEDYFEAQQEATNFGPIHDEESLDYFDRYIAGDR